LEKKAELFVSTGICQAYTGIIRIDPRSLDARALWSALLSTHGQSG